MNFMATPSLEHVALVKVAASLWNQDDVRALVTEFSNSQLFSKFDEVLYYDYYISSERKEKWQKIEEKVIEKVPQLMITAILEKEILGFIQAVGIQILRWMEYHRLLCCFEHLHLPNQFFWTPQGVVDRKKTAEVLVKDESIDISTRYKFACIYCLENDVPKLWNGLPKSIQKSLFTEENKAHNMVKSLLTFWRKYLHGEMGEFCITVRQRMNINCSAYSYMFAYAVCGGNKAATEYFLQKLLHKRKYLLKAAQYVVNLQCESKPCIIYPPKEYYSEVLCFLLSQMNAEQQVKIFKKLPHRVSCFFLEWPWQNFFVNVVSRLWNSFHGQSYHVLFGALIQKVIFRCIDYDYRKLFRELWQQTPYSHKRYIMHDSLAGLLNLLFEIKDKEIMKLVVQDATVAEKNAFIFGENGRQLCEFRIHQLDLLKFFIQLFISSKEGMIKFKQEYEKYIEREQLETKNPNRTEFLTLLDDLVRVYDKRRNLDEGDSSVPKRLCTIDLKDMAQDTKKFE